MSLDADQIVDRRRLRRKLTFWRVLTVLVVIAAMVGARLRVRRQGALTGGPARLDRPRHDSGLIRGNQERVEALERLANSQRQGGHRPHRQPRRHHRRLRAALRLADRGSRPRSRWWSWSTGLRASGGYIAAIASDHIIAQQSVAGRLDRRAGPVSELHRSAEDHRRQGRGRQIVAAEGRAQRLRADLPGGARRARLDRDGLL